MGCPALTLIQLVMYSTLHFKHSGVQVQYQTVLTQLLYIGACLAGMLAMRLDSALSGCYYFTGTPRCSLF